jgi:hypothetical protein
MRLYLAVALFVGSTGNGLSAQIGPEGSSPPAAAPAKVNQVKKPRMVCETQDTIGTRLGAKRVCHPAGETPESVEARRDFSRMQTNLGYQK